MSFEISPGRFVWYDPDDHRSRGCADLLYPVDRLAHPGMGGCRSALHDVELQRGAVGRRHAAPPRRPRRRERRRTDRLCFGRRCRRHGRAGPGARGDGPRAWHRHSHRRAICGSRRSPGSYLRCLHTRGTDGRTRPLRGLDSSPGTSCCVATGKPDSTSTASCSVGKNWTSWTWVGATCTRCTVGPAVFRSAAMYNKPADWQGPPAAWLFYIRVDDVKTSVEKVQQLGGTLLNGPMEVPGGDFVAQCLDPQGGAFALHSSAPTDGA